MSAKNPKERTSKKALAALLVVGLAFTSLALVPSASAICNLQSREPVFTGVTCVWLNDPSQGDRVWGRYEVGGHQIIVDESLP
jgi:hypothetical protein